MFASRETNLPRSTPPNQKFAPRSEQVWNSSACTSHCRLRGFSLQRRAPARTIYIPFPGIHLTDCCFDSVHTLRRSHLLSKTIELSTFIVVGHSTMGKFSLKKGDGDDDSSRLALFGSRSKSKSPAPPSDNPYAQAAVPSDPYTRAKMNAGLGPPPGSGYPGPGPQGPQGAYGGPGQPAPRQNPYGANNAYGQPQPPQGGGPPPPRGGYGAEKFGNQNGYGAEKSGGNPYGGFSQTAGTARRGGYGGLGPTNDYNQVDDADRDQLFGGARERIEHKQQNNTGGPPGYQYNEGETSGADRSYGAYGDRQLTAEEEEEEDIQATKQEIRFMKQQDVSSTRNALQMAAQAEESGRNTLARLGAQGERMHNTERNLDIGNNHINIAEDKSRELKKLNRNMFAVHVNNPFTAKDRQAQKDEKIMDRHRLEREQRESTREATFKSTQRMNQNFKGIEDTYQPAGPGRKKPNLAERAKYQFEADEEDDQMEDEIDRNLDDLAGAAGRLNMLAKATGQEIEEQNRLIGRIADKVRLLNFFNLVRSANYYCRATNSTIDCTGRPKSSGAFIKTFAYFYGVWIAIEHAESLCLWEQASHLCGQTHRFSPLGNTDVVEVAFWFC